VRTDAEPGIIIRNMAEMEDALGRVARTYEDTLIVGPPVLGMSIDDLPDPVRATDELVYSISFSNRSPEDVSGVTVYAVPDPNLVFQSSSPAPLVPGNPAFIQWDIGEMMSTSADRIFASFTVNPTMPNMLFNGTLIPMRTWVTEADGNVASALEVTMFSSESGPDSPYLLNLSGGPRNLRIGVVETVVYQIKLSHEGVLPTSNVIVNSALPPALDFLDSDPGPTSIEGNLISFRFGTVQPGETKLIVLKAQLGPTAVPGSTLTTRAYVVDDQGNSAQASFIGGIRPGSNPSDGRLQVSLAMSRNVTVVGDRPTKLKSSINVTNGGRGDSRNVVVTLEGPASAGFDTATPGPSNIETDGGMLRLTWIFPTFKGPGNESIKVTHTIGPDLANGTNLNFRGAVRSDDGRSDTDTATVQVRKR
jgi:uncharacterized repeat protein (TIGR01451 family)